MGGEDEHHTPGGESVLGDNDGKEGGLLNLWANGIDNSHTHTHTYTNNSTTMNADLQSISSIDPREREGDITEDVSDNDVTYRRTNARGDEDVNAHTHRRHEHFPSPKSAFSTSASASFAAATAAPKATATKGRGDDVSSDLYSHQGNHILPGDESEGILDDRADYIMGIADRGRRGSSSLNGVQRTGPNADADADADADVTSGADATGGTEIESSPPQQHRRHSPDDNIAFLSRGRSQSMQMQTPINKRSSNNNSSNSSNSSSNTVFNAGSVSGIGSGIDRGSDRGSVQRGAAVSARFGRDSPRTVSAGVYSSNGSSHGSYYSNNNGRGSGDSGSKDVGRGYGDGGSGSEKGDDVTVPPYHQLKQHLYRYVSSSDDASR
jgi:hypothetical protein